MLFSIGQAMRAGSEYDLQRMLDRLNRILAEYNMKINTKKTKVMKIGKEKGEVTTMMIVIEGERIEEVKEFCYLGSMISNDAKYHREIRRRIAMGKEAFLKRKELLRGGLKRSLKKRMIKTLIWSVTLYCAESWTMRQVDIARLEAFEMWIWRRMERISWTEHISNEEVLTLVGEERSLYPQSEQDKETGWDTC